MGGISDRHQEINRRRRRRHKLAKLFTRLEKANASERALIVEKIRRLTPGASVILANRGLEKAGR